MLYLGPRLRTGALLSGAGLAGLLTAAVGIALWRLGIGLQPPLLWLAAAALGPAAAGVAARQLAGSAPPQRRSGLRLQAAGLEVTAASAALAVLLGYPYAAWVLALGVIAGALSFAVSLNQLSDCRGVKAVRLRRGLDGLFAAGCSVLCFWLLVPGGGTALAAAHPQATAVAAAGLATAGVGAVAAVRAPRGRRHSVWTASGLGLAVIAAAWVVSGLDRSLSVGWAQLAAAAWAVGALASVAPLWTVWEDAAEAAPQLPRTDVLVMATPALAATGAAVYHSAAVGPVGLDVVALSALTAAVLSARQVLARMDARRYAASLADREAYFRSIVSGSSDLTTVLDEKLRVRWQAGSREWTVPQSAVSRVPFSRLVHEEDAPAVENELKQVIEGAPGSGMRLDARIKDAAGRWRETESTVADQRAVPQVRGLVLHTRDVGERRGLERELAKLAYTDPLTGLSNRRALLRALESEVAGAAAPCSLFAVDLDGFKNVNDWLGHDVGDAVLSMLAERLRECMRPTDVAARLGGDEFAALLWCRADAAGEIAERLLKELSAPYRLPDGPTVFVSVSIGLAGCETADTVEDLLRNADMSLRAAKQRGKNRIAAYDAAFEKQLLRKTAIQQELRGAIERGELALAYQPVVCLRRRRVVGAEALMRWKHPELGQVSPGEFIPAAQEAELSDALTEWTLRTVAERLAAWRAAGHEAWISMNLSARQLNSPHFAQSLAAALLEQGVPPSRVVVEVTERDVAQSLDVLVAQLGALRGSGVRIALDDFGAGYSSLGQLHRLPVDIIKIDRDLVAGSAGGAAPLADIVVRLGRRLGLKTIAEGVETQAQLDVVMEADCEMVQGYLLAHPIPTDQIDLLLAQEADVHKHAQRAIEGGEATADDN